MSAVTVDHFFSEWRPEDPFPNKQCQTETMITARNGLCIIGRQPFRNVASINVGTVLKVAIGSGEANSYSICCAGLLAVSAKCKIFSNVVTRTRLAVLP